MTSLRINACISTVRSLYDETGKYLPSGNYYFTINEISNTNIKGTLRNIRINGIYIFSCKKFLKMMSNAQSRLIDFTGLRKEEHMPQNSFPITSNNNYFTGEYISPEVINNPSRYVVNYHDPIVSSNIIRRHNRILTLPPYYTNPYNPYRSESNEEIRDSDESKREDSENKCAICWEPVLRNSKILLCDHKFHRGCINTWLNQNNTCPLCRREVSPTINRNNRITRNRILRNNIITHSVIFGEIV